MIGHKTSLNKFKKIEILSSIFWDHRVLKVETSLKEETQQYSNSWRLNSMLLNIGWVKTEIKAYAAERKWRQDRWEQSLFPCVHRRNT